jgi:hypothetical protein
MRILESEKDHESEECLEFVNRICLIVLCETLRFSGGLCVYPAQQVRSAGLRRS